MHRPRLLLLDAGGTIAQVWDAKAQAVRYSTVQPFDWLGDKDQRLLSDVASIEFAWARGCSGDSSSFRPSHWGQLARQIFELRDAFDGFVVTHGTATLAYGASMLSYMLADLERPVVFTGAQDRLQSRRPGARSKAFSNLLGSVLVAAEGVVSEVAIVFGGRILRGNRSTKTAAHAPDGFRSPNFPELGRVRGRSVTHGPLTSRPQNAQLSARRRFLSSEAVVTVNVHPGLKPEWIDQAADNPAVLVGGYGAGIVPAGFHEQLSRIASSRLVVVYASSGFGGAPLTTSPPIPTGAVWARDMTYEAAFTKVCWVLAQSGRPSRRRGLFSADVAGEVTEQFASDAS